MRPARARVALSLAVFWNENGEFMSVAILPAQLTSRKPDKTFVVVGGLCYKLCEVFRSSQSEFVVQSSSVI